MTMLSTRIRSMIDPGMVSDDVADGISLSIAERMEQDAQDIPYPVASIVCIGDERYLVAGIAYVNCGSQPAAYTLRGHPELLTDVSTRAWKSHADLYQLEPPSAESWRLLKDAIAIDERSRIAA